MPSADQGFMVFNTALTLTGGVNMHASIVMLS
jgi:hypothetical protein